ncbi:hypothetical protein Tco_0849415 [Tanacetum coccineum]
MATGIKSCGTRSHEPTRVVNPHVIEDGEDIGASGTTSQKPHSKVPCAAKNKRKRTQQMDGVETEILVVLKVIANRIVEPEQPPKPEPPTLEDCQNKLKTIGWAEDDPLYEVALAIFCEPNDRYREGWMQLKAERYSLSDGVLRFKIRRSKAKLQISPKTLIVRSSVPITNCILGLANAKTWDAILSKTFGLKIPRTMGCAEEKKGKRKISRGS